MVSPSKKRKDNKGRENDYHSLVKDKTGSKKSKPFASKRFYLDIKNNASLLKLEDKLKSLGAIIEQFLVKEVNYVVTDRKDSHTSESNSTSASTPATPSPSPSSSFGVSSPLDGLGQKKIKSRAEAMLEKVRLQPQSVKIDPLDNARAWNIPIYSQHEILIRLQKLCAKEGRSTKNPGVKVLHGNYMKLETGGRPEFKQFRKWPNLNLNCANGESPFFYKQDVPERVKTRKLITKDGSERQVGGYCEMCCEDYLDINVHVLTPEHIKQANRSDCYAQLDNIIKAKTIDSFISSQMCASQAGVSRRCLRSGSVDNQINTMGSRNSNMFHSNGLLTRTRASTRSLDETKPLEVQCNGITIHNHLTRSSVKFDSSGVEPPENLKRTRTTSASLPVTTNEHSQLSPTGSDTTHHLRSRKQMWLPTSLIGTTAEDVLTNSRLRPSRDYPPITPTADESVEKKIQCNGKDVEEEQHNKVSTQFNYNTALPLPCNVVEKTNSNDVADCIDETGKFDEPVENNVEDLVLRDKQVSNKRSSKHSSRNNSNAHDVANSRSNHKKKKIQKKRLSVEEKLIEDNKSYYKVEVLNSKLRSTGYYITQSQRELEMSRSNGTDGCAINNSEEPVKSDIKTEEKEPVVVRFKKVRQTELSLLSDEAESFMFGEPKRDSSVSTDTSEEDEQERESHVNETSVSGLKKEIVDESSVGSCSMSSCSTSKRKRKSQDSDNSPAEYYKHETASLCQRSPQTATITDTKDNIEEFPNNSNSANEFNSELKQLVAVQLEENNSQQESIDNKPDVDKSCTPLYENLEFSFESDPVHEAWYQTFRRQDTCNEYYYPQYQTHPKVLLPYEYPNSILKRIKIAATKEKDKKRKKTNIKIQQLVVDDKPRKSPRCHASTLAIMSSLKRRRPRDSPEKKTDLSSEVSICRSEVVPDEDSKCSSIIDPPSVMSQDTQASLEVPEIKIESKPDGVEIMKKTEAEIIKEGEKIEELFSEVFSDNKDDLIAHILQVVKKEIESPSKDSHKKGKSKAKTGKVEWPNASMCLPVDPDILEEDLTGCVNVPGPTVDMINLIDGFRNCTSMERADYEHMHPDAVDAFRALIADSCNSSECGGSSACDYGFLDDNNKSKKRKRKKRNMTGWPANNKRKLPKKGEDLSTTVLKRNCLFKSVLECNKEQRMTEGGSSVVTNSELATIAGPSVSTSDICDLQDQNKADPDSKPDNKRLSTISRTSSIDSSSNSIEVQSCYIRVNKMSDSCVDNFSRHLRSADRIPQASSSRRSPRKAKITGRQSLRRCK